MRLRKRKAHGTTTPGVPAAARERVSIEIRDTAPLRWRGSWRARSRIDDDGLGAELEIAEVHRFSHGAAGRVAGVVPDVDELHDA